MSNLKALEILKTLKFKYESCGHNKTEIAEAIAELEALENKDRLAELEKVILDYYLAKGYQVGVRRWRFNVEIESNYKLKFLMVYFKERKYDHYDKILEVVGETTKEMFDKAFEHFSLKAKND